MRFNKSKTRDYYLLTTEIENVYINEYMADAPGDYVKAYVYGLFCAENGMELKNSIMAGALKMDEAALREAWEYWQSRGVAVIEEDEDDYHVIFVNLREKLYSGEKSLPVEKAENSEEPEVKEFREVIEYAEAMIGRPLNAREMREINSWNTDLEASGEVIREAFEYCSELGKTGISYISKVIMGWTREGLRTSEDVRDYLERVSERQGIYRRILNSIGLKRNITEPERKMVDTWFDDMHFTLDRVLEACEKSSFTQSPNLKYVNKVLENWKEEADQWGRDVNQRTNVTQNTLNKYYEYLRGRAEKRAEARRQEVYDKLPEIREIDIKLQQLSSNISRGLLGGSTRQDIDSIKSEIRELEKQRAIALTENNYALDYTDIKYLCAKCGDTGIDENGQRCTCVKDRMGEAELWQNGRLS
ncbi:MAG: DnaD domain protein [Firmicutes bacterium]|nr:DnaD domain protein [Bacillota bacterium]